MSAHKEIQLMLITNDPELARASCQAGVNRIFVDLESHGKKERQGHLDTFISGHTIEDVARVRQAIPGREILVRLNPLHAGTPGEIDAAATRGADFLMLPMFRKASELEKFVAMVGGRARVVPLVETPEALSAAGEVARVKGIHEVFVGLNDLSLAMGLKFMFQLLSSGAVERAAKEISAAGTPFGFGGIGRMGEGDLKAELILSEHVRLGSNSVILSRKFRSGMSASDIGAEVRKIRQQEARLRAAGRDELERNRKQVVESVEAVLRKS